LSALAAETIKKAVCTAKKLYNFFNIYISPLIKV